jgi:hypothetical protein
MGTSVVLDGAVLDAGGGEGSAFGAACLAAVAAGEGFEVEEIDGGTGRRKDGGEAAASSKNMARLRGELGPLPPGGKEGTPGGREKRRLMEEHPLFRNWHWRRRNNPTPPDDP